MKVVISYRRADSQDIAGRIGDHLRRYFGRHNVFIDTGSIPAGVDFRTAIASALRPGAVLVAIIGRDWAGVRVERPPRIQDEHDEIRFEIETALKNGVRIIPVLVNGATMPTAGDLPPSLKAFAGINALNVESGRDFPLHMAAVIRATGPGYQPRRAALALALTCIAAFAIGMTWLLLPTTQLVWLRPFSTSEVRPVSDIEVASFQTPDARPELDYIRQKVERNFVDLFSDAKLRVRSSLTTNQSLDRSHFTLAGRITERAGIALVSAELRDAAGLVVGSSQIEGRLADLEAIYKVIPEALMLGMDVDPAMLAPRRRAARPTASVEALAYFLQARRDVHSRDWPAAERAISRAIEIDPNFAMAYWAMGEIKRLQGDSAQAAQWYKQASDRHSDHQRWSIQPAQETQPVPPLLAQLRAAQPDEAEPGARYAVARLPDYDIALHVWTFDPQRFALKVRQQNAADGLAVGDFLTEPDDVFAINGGFFDSDSRQRLTPSGLLIVDNVLHRDITDKGTGIVYATASDIGISFRQEFHRAGVVHAVQSGPLIVDPGGKLGIYRNDFDRQNRSAICLDGHSVIVVLAEGGLSLFELGQVLATPRADGGLGCQVALNLDGGQSTQAAFKTRERTLSITGRWRIQNALVLSRRASPLSPR